MKILFYLETLVITKINDVRKVKLYLISEGWFKWWNHCNLCLYNQIDQPHFMMIKFKELLMMSRNQAFLCSNKLASLFM